jgi:hypothetical protein
MHVVVIDQMDAVLWKRTWSEDSGESTRSSVVNQILTKLDGTQAIRNVLCIGMTNRKELLDKSTLVSGAFGSADRYTNARPLVVAYRPGFILQKPVMLDKMPRLAIFVRKNDPEGLLI